MQVETRIFRGAPSASPGPVEFRRDPYRGVTLVLLVAALAGTVAALNGATWISSNVLLDTAVALGLTTGILVGVARAQAMRARSVQDVASASGVETERFEPIDPIEAPIEAPDEAETLSNDQPKSHRVVDDAFRELSRWYGEIGGLQLIRMITAVAGFVAIGLIALNGFSDADPLSVELGGFIAAACLVAAGLAAVAARYLGGIDRQGFPEAPSLCRGAMVVGWILVIAAGSIGVQYFQQQTVLRVIHFTVLLIIAAGCYGMIGLRQPQTDPSNHPSSHETAEVFPLDYGVLSVLASRPNILGSILDAAEQQLGIDLRSTWALTVVRQSIEPLVIGLLLLGWLSTSLTVVGLREQGLVERWGVLRQGQALQPGLHLHWPWPVDRIYRVPVLAVQALPIGDEGEEAGGPENVIWTVQHAPNEYNLLLGNGRDLISIDATVQYRITDPKAWLYNTRNPLDALRAIAYRAVMRSTVNRTLTDALSENMVTLAAQMRDMVQRDADALGLGVRVVGFTVGAMHPPVMVAEAYEGVVSAELGKVTAMVNAQTYRNQTVPAAEAAALTGENTARADGAESLALAAGEAWAFRALESQYRAAPQEYFFRRRLETLEKGLAGRGFTIVDSRFQRDGGELWLTQ